MIEIVNAVIAVLAVIVSAVALIRTRQVSDKQIRLQERQLALEEEQARFASEMREAERAREERGSKLVQKLGQCTRLGAPYEGHKVDFENLGGRASDITIRSDKGRRIRLEPTDVLDSGRMGTLHFEHPIDRPLDDGPRNPRERWGFSIEFTDRAGNRRAQGFSYATSSGQIVEIGEQPGGDALPLSGLARTR